MQIKSGRNILIGIVLLTSIILTTIVYSAFNTQLNIEGEAIVRSDQDIRITNISISNRTNGAYETYNNKYNKDTTFMYVTLPANSSITYEIEITNKVSDSYLIDSITQESHTNSNVNVDISLNQNDVVNANSTKTFTITLTNNTSTEQQETLVYKYEFKLNNFTVTFDANGGQVSTPSKTVSYGSTYGSLPTPTRTGYTFKGWNGKNMFNEEELLMAISGATYEDGYYIFSPVNARNIYGYGGGYQRLPIYNFNNNTQYTISIYGHTTATTLDILYDYTDGLTKSSAFNNQQDDVFTFSSTEDKTIDKIRFSYQINNLVYAKYIQLEEGSTATPYEPYYLQPTTTVVQQNNHTLKAIWEPNTYEIVFDKNANDATGTMSNQSMMYDESDTLSSNTFERTGYIFGGWNTKSDGSGTSYTNEQSVSNLAPSGTITLYAQWKKAYAITNLLTYGSFENEGWTNCEYDNTTKYVGNYSCLLTNTIESPEKTTYHMGDISLDSTHVYYVSVYSKSSLSTYIEIFWPVVPNGYFIPNNATTSKWQRHSTTFTRNNFSDGNYSFRIDFNNQYKDGYINFDGFMLVDLTETFGEGNEPNQEWCDNNIEYFDGTTTVYK